MGKSTKVVVPTDGGALEYLDRGDGKAELVGVKAVKRQSPGGGSPGQAVPVPDDLESLKALDLIAFNSAAERRFVELLDGLVGQPVRVVKAEAAYRLGISVETAKRYVEKWTAPSAPFAVVGGIVVRKQQ